MKTYPLLFEGLIEWTYPEDITQKPIPPEPNEWLGRIAEQADNLVLRWHEDWPVNAHMDVRNARDFALDGIRALLMGDAHAAMIAAFNAGRAVEKAQRSFPIQAWLQLSKVSKDGADEGRKTQADLASRREAKVIRLFQELTESGIEPRHTTAKIESKLKGTELEISGERIRQILKKAGLK